MFPSRLLVFLRFSNGISRTNQGNCQDDSWEFPGNVRENDWKDTIRDMSGKCYGNVWKNYRKFTRKLPRNLCALSGKHPETIQEISKTIPGHVLEISETFPGMLQQISRTPSGYLNFICFEFSWLPLDQDSLNRLEPKGASRNS